MAASEAIVKSCLCISDVSCYEVAKDFAGPMIAIIVAFFSVRFAFKQIAEQHRNTLLAQKEESKRNTRIEMFKEFGWLLEESSTVIREVNSYCIQKKYSLIGNKPEIDYVEHLNLMKKFGDALLTIVATVEAHEIVSFKLFRVFRFSLQSTHHDLLSLQSEKDRSLVLDKFLDLTNDAQMYMSDFQVCLQNMAYGEIFESQVPYRVPPDKRIKVITNDLINLEELHNYFWRETNWGKTCIQYEKEAEKKHSS